MDPMLPNEAVIRVPDLTESIEYFTSRLGFRLDMIVPADDPVVAILTGQGLRLRLESPGGAALGIDRQSAATPELIVTRFDPADGWHAGRAGMLYRDLIPDRLGGKLIASHIRIPDGGPVPDYVHYHKVRFQMIFCRKGWVRVVYEDQGPPFVLEAGDCVLQPPGIRHRVLESSSGLEVIEIGSPAVHETWSDHDLQLPTPDACPGRIFEGQRFVHHRSRDAIWSPWRHPGFEARDTGISEATGGLADVRIVRGEKGADAPVLRFAGRLLFLFVLKGEMNLNARELHRLQAGDICVVPPNSDYALQAGPDLELLEVILPAQ